MSKLRDRPTADLIIMFLTGLVGIALLVTYVGVFLIEILHPEEDTSTVVEASSEVMGIIVGAIVGYVAGAARKSGGGTTVEETDEHN